MLRLLALGVLITIVGAHDMDEPTYAAILRIQGFSDADIEIFLQVILFNNIDDKNYDYGSL